MSNKHNSRKNNSNNIIEDCQIKSIGEGSFGIVYKCGKYLKDKNNKSNIILNDTKKKFAVKYVIERKSSDRHLIENEVGVLEYLFYNAKGKTSAWDNENIVKYYKLTKDEKDILEEKYIASYYDKSNSNQAMLDLPYTILKFEYCNTDMLDFMEGNYSDTYKKVKPKLFPRPMIIDERRKECIHIDFRNQVFNGLYYLFQHYIINFDIKPENIFISINEVKYAGRTYLEPTYKIGDFGLAKHYEHSTTNEIKPFETSLSVGTRGYLPMYDRMTKTKNMYIVLAPAFFTSYLRDLYAFFICLDL
jgi:serine/threonine protein kinase